MIGIIDYGAGNMRSVSNALDHLGIPWRSVAEPSALPTCRGLILPGVGSFRAMSLSLVQSGLWWCLEDWLARDRPYLGVCLGMQALFEGSDEAEECSGVGFFSGRSARFQEDAQCPHIGWNTVRTASSADSFYFSHSFRVGQSEEAVGWTDHGGPFVSWVKRGRVEGVQFHPEKSGSAGLRLLAAWCRDAQ